MIKSHNILIYKILIYTLLMLVLLGIIFPLFWTVANSFKNMSEMFCYPPLLFPRHPTFRHYEQLFVGTLFLRNFLNSLFIAICYTLLALLLCSLAGFGFSKYDFRFKKLLFGILLFSMMIPVHTILVPLFVLMVRIKWVDTYYAMIIPWSANAFGIFFLSQYMGSIPSELIGSARIDGCSELKIYWNIILPLSSPGLVMIGLILFMDSWNQYIWPLIVLRSKEMHTIPVFLTSLVGLYKVEYGMIMASSFLALLPTIILFLFLKKGFVSGILAGALKM